MIGQSLRNRHVQSSYRLFISIGPCRGTTPHYSQARSKNIVEQTHNGARSFVAVRKVKIEDVGRLTGQRPTVIAYGILILKWGDVDLRDDVCEVTASRIIFEVGRYEFKVLAAL